MQRSSSHRHLNDVRCVDRLGLRRQQENALPVVSIQSDDDGLLNMRSGAASTFVSRDTTAEKLSSRFLRVNNRASVIGNTTRGEDQEPQVNCGERRSEQT